MELDTFINVYKPERSGSVHDEVIHKFENIIPHGLIEKFGTLKKNEIFYFAPALVIGGAEEIKYVDKGNSQVHLHLLFQLS